MAGMLITAAVALTAPGSAAALPTTCNGAAIPALMRAEGLTEETGDVILDCTGGTPTTSGNPIPPATVTVFLSAPVNGRVLAPGWGEPELLVDDPPPNAQLGCTAANGVCTVNGTGTGNGVYDGSAGRFNVYQGSLTPPNRVDFSVPLDAPASGGTRRLRIVNLRGNATVVPLGVGGIGQVQAALSIAPIVPINNSLLAVGSVQPGLTAQARTPDNSAPLTTPTQLRSCDGTQKALSLRYSERMATAFRQRTQNTTDPASPLNQNVPGALSSLSESGFFNSSLVGNLASRGDLRVAGLADSGTRLRGNFAGVPAGTQLYVPTTVPLTPQTVMVRTPNETGPFAPVLPSGDGPAGTAPVPVSSGAASVYYEVLRANDTAVETADVPVFVNPGTTGGTATFVGGYAPQTSTSIPRFTGGSPPVDAFTVVPCAEPPPPSTPTNTVTVTNTATTTTSTPGPTVTVTAPTAVSPGASKGELVASRIAIDARGGGALPVRCNGASDCDFKVTLTGGKTARARAVTLGAGSGHVAAGQPGTVRVKLRSAARRGLARTGRLSAQLTGTVTSGGTSAPLTGRVVLQGRRQK